MKTVVAVIACFLLAVGGLAYKLHSVGGLAGAVATLAGQLPSPAGDAAGPSAEDVAGFERWIGAGTGEAAARGTGSNVYFQYADETGNVHFVKSLDAVPAHLRDRAGRIELAARPKRPAARGRRADGARPYAPASAPAVVVYTAPWCGWCRKTVAHLDGKGVRYDNRDIEADPAHLQELLSKSGGTSIPVTEIDGELVRGFDPKRIDTLLDAG